MSGPVIRNPVPAWMRPENASVLDSPLEKAIKALASLLGANDPNSQVMGLMNPAEVAGGVSPVAQAIEAISKKVKGIRAYHGSPHDFDQFSLDKIGTGEGAQAYGHGLYFAENPGVARDYRNRLTQERRVELDGFDHDKGYGAVDPASGEMRWFPNEKDAKDFKREAMGRMYEVNINADPEDFLDWDAPLSQQSEKVRQALERDWLAHPVDHAQQSGRQIYDATAMGQRDVAIGRGRTVDTTMPAAQSAASRELLNAGIPGIKYLDQGSRTAGEGTRNYVVFDDKLISIVKKYGVLGALSAGLINEVQARQLSEQGYGQ